MSYASSSSRHESSRRAKVKACTECQTRKLRCDGMLPHCTRCINFERTRTCLYLDAPKRSPMTRKYVTELEMKLAELECQLASYQHRQASVVGHRSSDAAGSDTTSPGSQSPDVAAEYSEMTAFKRQAAMERTAASRPHKRLHHSSDGGDEDRQGASSSRQHDRIASSHRRRRTTEPLTVVNGCPPNHIVHLLEEEHRDGKTGRRDGTNAGITPLSSDELLNEVKALSANTQGNVYLGLASCASVMRVAAQVCAERRTWGQNGQQSTEEASELRLTPQEAMKPAPLGTDGDRFGSGSNTIRSAPRDLAALGTPYEVIVQTQLPFPIDLIPGDPALPHNLDTIAIPDLAPESPISSWSRRERAYLAVLLNTYFTLFHPQLPLVHEPTIRAQLTGHVARPGGLTWTVLLYGILAMAAFMRGDVEDEGRTEGSKSHDLIFYRAARQLIVPALFEGNDLITVQATALLSLFSQKRNLVNSGWQYLGIAIRTAQSLGMHKESVVQGLPPFEAEMRRRAWWCVFVSETAACLALAKPSAIFRSGCTTDYPLNVNDEELVADLTERPKAKETLTLASPIILQARFAFEVHAAVLDRLLLARTPDLAEMYAMDDTVVDFLENIPDFFRLDSLSSTCLDGRQKAHTNEGSSSSDSKSIPPLLRLPLQNTLWRILGVRIILYRPWFMSTHLAASAARKRGESVPPPKRASVAQASALCLKLSRQLIDSIAEYNPDHQAAAWVGVYHLTQGAYVPLLELLSNVDLPNAPELARLIKTSLDLFESLGRFTIAAARSATMLRVLAADLDLEGIIARGRSEADSDVQMTTTADPEEHTPVHLSPPLPHGNQNAVDGRVPPSLSRTESGIGGQLQQLWAFDPNYGIVGSVRPVDHSKDGLVGPHLSEPTGSWGASASTAQQSISYAAEAYSPLTEGNNMALDHTPMSYSNVAVPNLWPFFPLHQLHPSLSGQESSQLLQAENARRAAAYESYGSSSMYSMPLPSPFADLDPQQPSTAPPHPPPYNTGEETFQPTTYQQLHSHMGVVAHRTR